LICNHFADYGELHLSGVLQTGKRQLTTFPITGKLQLHIQPKTSNQ
jgi:hypothetical protein